MKKLVLFPIAALAFTAACADSLPTASSADASFNRGPKASSGITVTSVSSEVTVAGLFTVTIPGAGGLIVDAPGINEEGKEHGWCHAGGEWENPSGNRAASIPHAHCTREGGDRQVSWAFSHLAQFVKNTQNTNLNFKDLDDYKVHYHSGQNRTQATGLFTHEADGGVWALDLAQFAMNPGNAFVSCSSGDCLNATVTFTYQGVVYEGSAQLSW
jgi:hypothetical protein